MQGEGPRSDTPGWGWVGGELRPELGRESGGPAAGSSRTPPPPRPHLGADTLPGLRSAEPNEKLGKVGDEPRDPSSAYLAPPRPGGSGSESARRGSRRCRAPRNVGRGPAPAPPRAARPAPGTVRPAPRRWEKAERRSGGAGKPGARPQRPRGALLPPRRLSPAPRGAQCRRGSRPPARAAQPLSPGAGRGRVGRPGELPGGGGPSSCFAGLCSLRLTVLTCEMGTRCGGRTTRGAARTPLRALTARGRE